jgi:hypothetical protein
MQRACLRRPIVWVASLARCTSCRRRGAWGGAFLRFVP